MVCSFCSRSIKGKAIVTFSLWLLKRLQCLDHCLFLPWSTKDPGVEIVSNNIPPENTKGRESFSFGVKGLASLTPGLKESLHLTPASCRGAMIEHPGDPAAVKRKCELSWVHAGMSSVCLNI